MRFLLLLSSYPDFPPHIYTLTSLLPIIGKKEGSRYLSNVAAKQQPAGALTAFLHPCNICQYQPIYTTPPQSVLPFARSSFRLCFRPPSSSSLRSKTRNNWVHLFLPRARQDPKTPGVQSYLIPHLILLGNDTILGTASLV